jgi:putative FmdB family regulatory protein
LSTLGIAVPIYGFRCTACRAEHEVLAALGQTEPRPCPDCGGQTKLRLGRVAVRYAGWGFTATDSLVSDTRGKDFHALRDKADQISEE